MDNINEMAVSEVRYDLAIARSPNQVLAEAQGAAKALQSVIEKSTVKFNGKQYLTFEHWQTCGRFYGVTAKIISTEFIEIDGAKGFIARAEAINTQTGQIVSAAESMCMNDEKNWKEKPLFQLRSMAQTRACAKSLRNVLAWVVVLAGFEPAVAEEMTGEETGNGALREPIPSPKVAAPTGDFISEAQGKRLFAIWKGAGKTNEQVAGYLFENYSISSTKEIKRSDYDKICAWAQAGDAQ